MREKPSFSENVLLGRAIHRDVYAPGYFGEILKLSVSPEPEEKIAVTWNVYTPEGTAQRSYRFDMKEVAEGEVAIDPITGHRTEKDKALKLDRNDLSLASIANNLAASIDLAIKHPEDSLKSVEAFYQEAGIDPKLSDENKKRYESYTTIETLSDLKKCGPFWKPLLDSAEKLDKETNHKYEFKNKWNTFMLSLSQGENEKAISVLEEIKTAMKAMEAAQKPEDKPLDLERIKTEDIDAYVIDVKRHRDLGELYSKSAQRDPSPPSLHDRNR